MRQIIERVTCDHCGQVFDFEKLKNDPMLVRIESLTDWLRELGWKCQPIIGSNFQVQDFCPNCSK